MSDEVHKITMEEFIRAMNYLRVGLKTIWKDGYSHQVDLRIDLVREVMKKQKLPPGDAARFISNRSTNKHDPFIWAAALEIIDEEDRKVELN